MIERFNSKIDKASGAPCWNWTGTKWRNGYGRFFVTRRKAVKAHRFAWELHHGRPVPDGLVVCHSCDNKQCVNPDHLQAETQAFNVREAVDRKRWKPNFGIANGRTVLSREQAQEIRTSCETQMVLAKRFGISQTHVSRIIRGESWA
jgi:hypothetical protein